MRFSTRSVCAALLVALAASSASCTGDEPKPPCNEQPEALDCAPASATPTRPSAEPTRDVVVDGVSVRRILEVAREQLQTDFDFTFVFAGEEVTCTLSGGVLYTVSGTGSDRAFYCQEGYIAVPSTMTETFATALAVGIWYDTARAAVSSDPAYAAEPSRGSCAAAYIATKMPGYKPDADGGQLLRVLYQQGGAEESAFATAGLNLARGGKPMNGCKTVKIPGL